MARTRRIPIAGALLAAGLALPAPALALDPVVTQVIAGRFNPCQFTEAQLRTALQNIPNDLAQYGPEIESRIRAGLAARARGACQGNQLAAPTAAVPPGGGTTAPPTPPAPQREVVVLAPPAPPATPRPATAPVAQAGAKLAAATTDDAPAPLVALLAFTLLLMGTVLVTLAVRALGVGRRLGPELEHAFAEAGFRAGAAWTDVRDRLRR